MIPQAFRRLAQRGDAVRSTNAVLQRSAVAAAVPAKVRGFYADSVASGANALYLESLYTQWKINPAGVDAKWSAYFQEVEAGQSPAVPAGGSLGAAAQKAKLSVGAAAGGAATAPRVSTYVASSDLSNEALSMQGVSYLVRAYQVRGHDAANLDPLGLYQWRDGRGIADVPELDHKFHGFNDADLSRNITTSFMDRKGSCGGHWGFLGNFAGMGDMTLGCLIDTLKSTYCGSIGVEYMHIADRKRCNWIRSHVENPDFLVYDRENLMKTYERIVAADEFEQFLGGKFKTTKRFGLDGGESVICGLEALVDRARGLGATDFVIAMPHRGRLNVLANVLQKPLEQLFAEFKDVHYDFQRVLDDINEHDWTATSDVKYHLGTFDTRKYADGHDVNLTLECNPSHLETVNPVAIGRARAKQFYLGDTLENRKQVVPIVMHGDASFAGQGVNYETMQLVHAPNFDVGGTIHIIVNNQVGFTTDPWVSRSTPYASDLGKAFNVPIFHVNGDDPVAVSRAFEIAAEWRHHWGSDVILDVVCYRRFGHNENDNPDFTQPEMYKAVKSHPRVNTVFAQRLVDAGTATREELDGINAKTRNLYEEKLVQSENYEENPIKWVSTNWHGFFDPTHPPLVPKLTGMDIDLLRKIGVRLCEVPESFKLHSSLARQFKEKRKKIDEGQNIDWGTAEALAFGGLLLEQKHVRITGQDVQRGTFTHRHAVVTDQSNSEKYIFLNHLELGEQETLIAQNSILSEYAVLGFEQGYAYENPHALIIWEGQFGDFANTAQVMIDQFICSGEAKWHQQSGLVILLPHGYDGQGPEHSSARLERFLQMSDDDEDHIPDYEASGTGRQIQQANWQIMNITTPANYFHALRRQVAREFRKPLIITAPKALLRHKAAVSSLEDMATGTKFLRIIPERNPTIKPEEVDKLIFCSGKIYYELVAEREKLQLKNVAIVTLESIAPFPYDLIKEQLELYSKVDHGDGIHPGNVIWCQEEPKNMGAWTYVRPRLVVTCREGLKEDSVMRYVGRRAAAAPATGMAKLHASEQEAIVSYALLGHCGTNSRASVLLGHDT